MSKPILFIDFDGTICHDRYWRSLDPKYSEKLQKLLFQKDLTMVRDWMLGKYTAEEINCFVADKLDIEYKKLWGIFVADCKNMNVSNNVLNQIDSLRYRYTTLLITGNMDSFSRFTEPALKLRNYFDYISNSYDEGVHKTDDNGSIFTKYINRFHASILDSIVIDDSDKVCALFRKLGGRAFLATPSEDISYHLNRL